MGACHQPRQAVHTDPIFGHPVVLDALRWALRDGARGRRGVFYRLFGFDVSHFAWAKEGEQAIALVLVFHDRDAVAA